MKGYCFISKTGKGIPGVCIYADSLNQARRHVRKNASAGAVAYIGTTLPRDAIGWLHVALARDLAHVYASLIVNGCSAESLAHFRKEWHFTPGKE